MKRSVESAMRYTWLIRLIALSMVATTVMVAAVACAEEEPTATPVPPTATPVPPTATPEPEPEEAMTGDGMMMREPAPLLDPDSVTRENTLIVMSGGQDGRYPDWENFNNYVPGGVGGWHTGPLQTITEPLIMFNLLTGEHEMWLAEKMDISDDFSEVTLTIRDGIYWSDGMPYTAEDVAFTFNMVLEHQDQMVHTAEIHLLDSVEVIDGNKVKFTLKDPSPSWWVNTLDQQPRPFGTDRTETHLGRQGPVDLHLLRP